MNNEEQRFLNDLDKRLWTAANKLLPMLDAAVYKHVVLGLIFLKYVSDAFNERRAELDAAFRNPEDDYYLGDDSLIEGELEMDSVWLSSWLALRGDLDKAMYIASRGVSGSLSTDFSQRTNAVIASFQQALRLREKVFGPFHFSCGEIHRRLASFYLEMADFETSEQLLRKALTIALSSRGPYHPETLKCLETSQEMLRLAGRHNEASEMETRIDQVEKKVRERARETYVVWGEPDDKN